MIGAVDGEVTQRGELRFYAIQPARIGGDVGQFDVVVDRPVADASVLLRRPVRAPIVEHDRDANLPRMKRPQVATEREELAATLAGLDMTVEPVGRQVVGAEQGPHAVRTIARGSSAPSGSRPTAASPGPVATRMRLEVQGPELVDADHHVGITAPGLSLAIGEVVELQDPVLLGL